MLNKFKDADTCIEFVFKFALEYGPEVPTVPLIISNLMYEAVMLFIISFNVGLYETDPLGLNVRIAQDEPS